MVILSHTSYELNFLMPGQEVKYLTYLHVWPPGTATSFKAFQGSIKISPCLTFQRQHPGCWFLGLTIGSLIKTDHCDKYHIKTTRTMR